jgi:hypothetical protein
MVTEKKPEVQKKYRVQIKEQWRDFDSQKEAIEMAKKILETGYIFYMTLENKE